MGKIKFAFIAVLLQVFWQKFFRKCLLGGPLLILYFCPNPSISLVVMVTEKVSLRKIFKKSTPQKL